MKCPHCKSNFTSSGTSGDYGTVICLDSACGMSSELRKIGLMWFVVSSEKIEELNEDDINLLISDD